MGERTDRGSSDHAKHQISNRLTFAPFGRPRNLIPRVATTPNKKLAVPGRVWRLAVLQRRSQAGRTSHQITSEKHSRAHSALGLRFGAMGDFPDARTASGIRGPPESIRVIRVAVVTSAGNPMPQPMAAVARIYCQNKYPRHVSGGSWVWSVIFLIRRSSSVTHCCFS